MTTFSDQDPMAMTFTYAGWNAIAIGLDMNDAEEADELFAKVTADIPANTDLGASFQRELTIAEWRFIRDMLYADLGRWQPTMADAIEEALAANGWVD